MAKNITMELTEALDTVKSLKTDLAQANDANQRASAQITEITKQLTDANAAHDLTKAELAKSAEKATADSVTIGELTKKVSELEANAKTASQRAGEMLGTVGAAPVEQVAAAVPTADELWAQYHALTDPKAKNEFYAKHRDTLTPKHAQAR